MTLSKQWFDDEIDRWIAHEKTCTQTDDRCLALGIISGLKIAYRELIKPPIKSEHKPKNIDIEKGFESILNYYMNNPEFIKLYPDIEIRKQKANHIALTKMDEQQKRLTS